MSIIKQKPRNSIHPSGSAGKTLGLWYGCGASYWHLVLFWCYEILGVLNLTGNKEKSDQTGASIGMIWNMRDTEWYVWHMRYSKQITLSFMIVG